MKKVLALTSLMFASTSAYAAPVDLSSWQQEGGGNWTLATGNNSVFQSVNTPDPAVFYNNTDSQGLALSGEITVQTNSDDDFIGFVLGYDTGDAANASANYLLIDWKQRNQALSNTVNGLAGLAVSKVSGIFDFDEFWSHTGAVTELQRATNLGSTGWADNTTYDFDLIFNANNVQVQVNGVTELNIFGSFANGSFGFYNLSQERVRYAGIEQVIAPPPPSGIPSPSALLLMGIGLLSLRATRRRA